MRYKLNDSGLTDKNSNKSHWISCSFQSQQKETAINPGWHSCAIHTLYMTDLHYKSLIPTKMMEILRFSHTSIDPGLFLSRHRFQKHASPTTLSLDMLAMNVNSRLSFFSLQHRWKERIYVSTARTNFADERNSYRTTIFSGRDRCINRSRTKIQRTP